MPGVVSKSSDSSGCNKITNPLPEKDLFGTDPLPVDNAYYIPANTTLFPAGGLAEYIKSQPNVIYNIVYSFVGLSMFEETTT
jgi:hypothetical protein